MMINNEFRVLQLAEGTDCPDFMGLTPHLFCLHQCNHTTSINAIVTFDIYRLSSKIIKDYIQLRFTGYGNLYCMSKYNVTCV